MRPLDRLKPFLPLLERPSRYLNQELNARCRDWEKAVYRVLLLFPDAYEVGLSHLGLRIIYHILNDQEGVLADRTYLPWRDALSVMEREGIPLWGLETGRPFKDFHLVEVSLQQELAYTNLLKAVEISGVPLFARERREEDPIVMAGGAAAVNPVPYAPFVDLVFVGESEEAQVEMAHIMVDALARGASREERIELLSTVEGVWSPAKGGGVRRRVVLDLEKAPFPTRVLMPATAIVHDRVTVEIMRGCSRGCRFCLAGFQYRPVRERGVAQILELARDGLISTGYEEVSLLSLTATDHSGIHHIIKAFMEAGEASFVSLSLPSLRSGTLTEDLIQEIRRVRKTGFTMAPEASTQRLRDVINKNITTQEIMETVDKVFSAGWDLMKLYFMIGLPTETREDLEGIAHLVKEIMARAQRLSQRRPRLHVSVSPFVPKPHTPFQWEPQDTQEAFREKIDLLKRLISFGRRSSKKRRGSWGGVELSFHNPRQSLIEALMARGGEEAQALLLEAYTRGALFDQWGETFDFSLWQGAMEAVGLNLSDVLYRTRDMDEAFPWDFVDIGVTKEFLWRERQRAMEGKTTPDCREVCGGCGLCDREITHRKGGGETIDLSLPPFGREVTYRLRVWLEFLGDGALYSHNHFVRFFVRLLRREGIPLAYRGKFNPQARVAFALALSTGMESLGEPCDLFLTALVEPGSLATKINPLLPRGVRIIHEEEASLDAPSLSKLVAAVEYRIHIPPGLLTSPFPSYLAQRLESLEGMANLEVDSEGGTISFLALPVKGSFIKPYQLVKEHLPIKEGKERAVRVLRRVILDEGELGQGSLVRPV